MRTSGAPQSQGQCPNVSRLMRRGVRLLPVLCAAAGGLAAPGAHCRTIIVAGHKKAKACAALAQTPAGAQGDAQCVVMFVGPIVVTDVHVGLGCPNEMIVLAGDAQGPRWYVVAPSGPGVGVHGASFTVPADEELIVVVRLGTAKAVRSDAACAVTWAGRKL